MNCKTIARPLKGRVVRTGSPLPQSMEEIARRGGPTLGKRQHIGVRCFRCQATTRRGTPCMRKALKNGRCPNHGGLSTGPKTEAGRKRISKAQRRRWAAWRHQRDKTEVKAVSASQFAGGGSSRMKNGRKGNHSRALS